MKSLSLLLLATFALLSSVSAGVSEKRLESEKKAAAEKGKLLVFQFEQAFYNPSCPKCIADVSANNAAIKRAIPRKYANLIRFNPGETRSLKVLPSSVKAAKGGEPQLIVTDASGEKVIATLSGRPDRKAAEEFEKKVAAAAGAVPPAK